MEILFELGDIESVAMDLLPFLSNVKVVAVNGDMGAGKTTLIHAICRQMGVTDNMSSPTYAIIQQYKTARDVLINHIDVYRLRDVEEAIHAGVGDIINSGDICFIEWAEKISNILPLDFITIFIAPVNHTKRRLLINNRQENDF